MRSPVLAPHHDTHPKPVSTGLGMKNSGQKETRGRKLREATAKCFAIQSCRERDKVSQSRLLGQPKCHTRPKMASYCVCHCDFDLKLSQTVFSFCVAAMLFS